MVRRGERCKHGTTKKAKAVAPRTAQRALAGPETPVTVTIPARIVRGLLDGEAMHSNSPEEMAVVTMLESARTVTGYPESKATVCGSRKSVTILAGYLESLKGLQPEERFGFTAYAAEAAADKLRLECLRVTLSLATQ